MCLYLPDLWGRSLPLHLRGPSDRSARVCLYLPGPWDQSLPSGLLGLWDRVALGHQCLRGLLARSARRDPQGR